MKHFLANGYCPSPHPPKLHADGYSNISFGGTVKTRKQRARSYREAGLDVPKLGETKFLSRAKIGRISLFVHGAYDTFIMVVAPSQRKAYLLGNTLRVAMTCFHGNPPMEQSSGYLLELSNPPTTDMNAADLANLINPSLFPDRDENLMLERELESGTGVNHIQLAEGCKIVANALDHPRLLDALMHLEYSRNLVWGFMVGSFYECHYSRDRRQLTRYQLERAYLENRFRYDSAFVSAFRGIECILGKPHFRKPEITFLLRNVDREFGTSFSTSRHRSWHEVFSSRRRWWKYDDLLTYYLKLRNAVSAHGNPSPPHIVMEDQVLEIQYFLQSMLGDILLPEEKDTGG